MISLRIRCGLNNRLLGDFWHLQLEACSSFKYETFKTVLDFAIHEIIILLNLPILVMLNDRIPPYLISYSSIT